MLLCIELKYEKGNNMMHLDFIEKGKKVYHIVNGWGVIISGEYGTGFQVQFPYIKQIQTYKPDGADYEGINRVIYQYEVQVVENSAVDDSSLYELGATVLENGDISLNFNGVNNSEILKVIESLMEVVVNKELLKGNTEEKLNILIDALSANMKQLLIKQEMPAL